MAVLASKTNCIILTLLLTLIPVMQAELDCTHSLTQQPWHAILSFLLDVATVVTLFSLLIRMIIAKWQASLFFKDWFEDLALHEHGRQGGRR